MKMVRRRKNFVSLQSNSVEIEPVGLFIKASNNLPIYNTKIGVSRFDLERTRVRTTRDDQIELRFLKELEKDKIKMTMEGKIIFFVNHVRYTIYTSLWVRTSYEQNRFDILMENFLYTYFSSMIESCDAIQRRKEIHLPESLEMYYESGSPWRSYQMKDYVLIGIEHMDKTIHRFMKPKLPSILNDEKKIDEFSCERIFG